MNKYERKKVEMYKAILRVMDLHADSRSALPALEDKYMAFKAKSDHIDELTTEAAVIQEGVRLHKDRVREDATAVIIKVVGSLKVYAQDQQLEELYALVDFHPSHVDGLSRARFLTLMEVLIARTTEHLSELDPYGITQADVDELLSLKDELSVLFFAAEQAILEGKSVTRIIKDEIHASMRLLTKFIDPLMDNFRTADPEFFAMYKSARKIHKAPVRGGQNEEDSPETGDDQLSNAG